MYATYKSSLGNCHFFAIYTSKLSIALDYLEKEVGDNVRILSVYCGDYDLPLDDVDVEICAGRKYTRITYAYVETRLLHHYTQYQRGTPTKVLSQEDRAIASKEWSTKVRQLVKKRDREKAEADNRDLGWYPYPPLPGEED